MNEDHVRDCPRCHGRGDTQDGWACPRCLGDGVIDLEERP